VLLALLRDTREAVDAITEKARKAGGKLDPTPQQDYGFMYGRSFEDPDGHIWEVMWMDPAAVEAGPAAYEAA
jgi:predicted lactoylglutathione lyase